MRKILTIYMTKNARGTFPIVFLHKKYLKGLSDEVSLESFFEEAMKILNEKLKKISHFDKGASICEEINRR